MKQKITLLIIISYFSLTVMGQGILLHSLNTGRMNPSNRASTKSDHKHRHFIIQGKAYSTSQPGIPKSMSFTKQRLDSLISYEWDATNMQWLKLDQEYYRYNDENKLIQYNYSNWDSSNGSWIPSDKEEYSYGDNGNVIEYISYSWESSDSTWTKYYKEIDTCNVNGKIKNYFEYTWDSPTSQWVISYKGESSFDIDGNETESIEYNWDKDSSLWNPSYKTELIYDLGKNNIQNIYSSWYEPAQQWNNIYKEELIYDLDNNLNHYLEYYWDNDSNQWLISDKNELSHSNAFSFSDLILPYYLSSETGNFFRTRLDSVLNLSWDENSSLFVENRNTILHYSEINQTSISEIMPLKVNVFPNPASVSLTFSLAESCNKFNFLLYDMQGHELIKKEINNHEPFLLTGIKPGIYIYEIRFDGKKLRGKIIKE